MSSEALINITTNACFKAGKAIQRDYYELLHIDINTKHSSNFISLSIRKTLDTLRKELIKYDECPMYEWDEVIDNSNGDQECFKINPLDGLQNFIYGLPFFSVVILLQNHSSKQDTKLSMLYFPMLSEIYYAINNEGVWLRDKSNIIGRQLKKDKKRQGKLLITNYYNCDLRLIEKHSILPDSVIVRTFGSITYGVSLLLAGKADYFYGYNIDQDMINIIKLFSKEMSLKICYINGSEKNYILVYKN